MVSKIDAMQYFAVPIFSKVLDGMSERQKDFVDLILKLRKENPGISRSNMNSWHSENDFHLRKDPCVKWLNQQAGKFAGTCLSSVNKANAKSDIIMNSCWANVGGFGAWHAPHNHFPSQWSGVFYVAVEECVNETDPKNKHGKIEFLNPSPIAHTYGQPNGVSISPKDGMILLFPAVLEHLVHPNLTDNLRITIAFNLNLIPKQGKNK